MAMDVIAIALSKKYTDESIAGGGISAGKNCVVDSITDITGGHRVTFKWTLDNGTVKTGTMDVMDGEKGERGETGATGAAGADGFSPSISITDITGGHKVTVTDASGDHEFNVMDGTPGEDGDDGFSPVITVATSTENTYILHIKTADDEFDTPNLKGSGTGGASSMSDLEDVNLDHLTDGQILVYNSSTHKWENGDQSADIESLGDIADVDLTSLADGQIIVWDATAQKWKNADAVNPTQFSTMPVAADYPEKIVQYTGADTANYKRGYNYRSTPSVESGSVVYSWVQTDTQPSNRDYDDLVNHPSINDVEVVGNKTLDNFGIAGKFQYESLPLASSANAGQICQYTGNTTASLKKNYWYEVRYVSASGTYEWVNVDVSGNAELAQAIQTLQTNQGDMTQLEIGGVSDIVSALNALNDKGLLSIVYNEPNLIITYKDGTVYNFDCRAVLSATDLGDLANILDGTIANTNVLAYDSSILKYKPYDVVAALASTLATAKDYTDTEIAGAVQDDAFICDAKPTCSYDSGTSKYTVVYYQNSVLKTTANTTARFYYKVSGDPYSTSWFVTGDQSVDPVEFTYLLSTPDFDDFVNKNTDITSTYTTDMVDKTKVPNVSAMDALLAIVNTSLALKINIADIIDNLSSNDATKPLSAKQGKALKDLVDAKQDTIQYTTLPTASAALEGVCLQYTGVDSGAYKKGNWYICTETETDVYAWVEKKYAADTDSTLDPTSHNPIENQAVCTGLDDKQDKTLATPVVVDGVSKTTVEATLSALNTYADKKIEQYASLPAASASLENKIVQFTGTTTSTLTNGFFYKCVEVAGSDPTAYTWVANPTQETVAVDGSTITKDVSTGEISAVTATNSTVGVVTDGDGTSIGANGEVNVVDRLEETTTLPTASATNEGKIYLLTSNQTGYEKGGVYECQETSTDVYEWVLISTSPLTFNSDDFDVVDDEVSLDASQKIKTFTQAEWDALSSAEKIALAGQNVIISDDEGTQTFEDIIPNDASSTNKLVTESEIPKTKIYTYIDAVTAGDNIILDPSSSHDWWNLFSSGNILSISLVSCDTANAMDVGAWVGTTTTNHSLILKPAITSSGSYYQVIVTYTGVSL